MAIKDLINPADSKEHQCLSVLQVHKQYIERWLHLDLDFFLRLKESCDQIIFVIYNNGLNVIDHGAGCGRSSREESSAVQHKARHFSSLFTLISCQFFLSN